MLTPFELRAVFQALGTLYSSGGIPVYEPGWASRVQYYTSHELQLPLMTTF